VIFNCFQTYNFYKMTTIASATMTTTDLLWDPLTVSNVAVRESSALDIFWDTMGQDEETVSMDWEVTPDTPNLKRKRDEESTWIPRKKRRISDSFSSPPALTLSSLFLSIIDSPATWGSFYYQPPTLGRTVRRSARLAALQ
jgi:hypothetical protein